MDIACRWLLATQRRCVKRLHRARSSRHSRHARPPWWQVAGAVQCGIALHGVAVAARAANHRPLSFSVVRLHSAARRADACDPQQHKPSRARGCVREYSECFSPQQSTRGCRYLLPPVTASTLPLQRRRRCNEHGHSTAAAISRNEAHDGSASKCLTTNGIIQSWQRSHLPCRRSATRS